MVKRTLKILQRMLQIYKLCLTILGQYVLKAE